VGVAKLNARCSALVIGAGTSLVSGDSERVMMVIWWCYGGVIVASRWCYGGVRMVLRWRYDGVMMYI
jgi:hypothetical protein